MKLMRDNFFKVAGLAIGVTLLSCTCHADGPAALPSSGSMLIRADSPGFPQIPNSPRPAKATWDSWSLLIGNGRLGGNFYGYVADEIIQFNEDSLWTGGDGNIWVPRKDDRLNRSDNINFGSYQPFGEIHLSLPHAEFTDYGRELDLGRGVGAVTYKSGGVTYRREYFCSYPDQVIVIRLTADKPGSISGAVQLTDRHLAKPVASGNTVTVQGTLDETLYISKPTPVDSVQIELGTPEQIEKASPKFAGNNMKYESQMRVTAEGGTVSAGAEGELKVADADSVTILLAAGTDYLADFSKRWKGADPHAKVTQQLDDAAKRPYEELLSQHIADYQALFNRVQIDLGRSDPVRAVLPMHERLADYRKDGDDPELVALMTNFGRYLMISSSRPGGRPANLQGLWNPQRILAPWGSDYHLNINLQMNYWQTGPGNLSECDEPLILWLQSIIPVLTRETKAKFGVRGWAAGWGINLFGGGDVGKKVEGAWLCWHLYENYRFSGNRKLMEQVSFPIIREAVYFWEDMLIEKDGLLLAPNVQSSEWGPTEDGVQYAQQIVWELFTEYVELADILGADKAHRNKISAMRDKLAGPRIGIHGEIMEWTADQPKLWGRNHRHISHLIGLFPGRQISPLATPDLAKAAVVSLENRGDGGTGWSDVVRAGSWARLWNGDRALQNVESIIQGHIWPNGLDSINTGASTGAGDKFQIDANFGLTAVVYEMLLQSQSGVIHLLPALPAKFPNGSVKGICARDGFLVDIDWKNGKLTRATIHSTFGNNCKVQYGDKVVPFEIKSGEQVSLDSSLTVVRSRVNPNGKSGSK